jgi:hypothetical protein
MEASTTSSYDKMSGAQLSILILLLLERIVKMFMNSKCYKNLHVNLFGMKIIDVNSEELEDKKEEVKQKEKESE